MSFSARPFEAYYAVPSRNGVAPPKASRGAGVPMVNMGDLFACPRIRDREMERVPLGHRDLERAVLQPNDLLFARRSLKWSGAGVCSIFLGSTEPTTFESSLIRVRLDQSKACPDFFFYLFRSPVGRRIMETIIEQTAVAGIKSSGLARLMVPVPDIDDQRRIASVSRVLDDKIDSNRRLAGLLEETAATLFRARFVNFVGVDEFEDSELGGIPRGWRVGPLSDVCENRPGKLLRPEGYAADGIFPVYGSNSVMGRSATFLYKGPLTVLARIGSNCGALRWSAGPCWVNNNASALVARPGTEPHWLHQTLVTLDYTQFRRGSGQPFLGLKDLMRHQIVIPPGPEQESAGRVLGPIEASATRLMSETETLAAIRNALLPNLISGQLRVPESIGPDGAIDPVAESVAAAAS